MKKFDVIVIGAGAAGMMCAWQAGLRGRRVCVIEHTRKIGEKIRISGGGRCNFTNLYCSPKNFLSQNPHFCKSALSRFTPQDFMKLLDARGVVYHEKPFEEKAGNESARGQMFCDTSAQDVVEMLRSGVEHSGGVFHLGTKVKDVRKEGGVFQINTDQGDFECSSLVVASGGLSIPKIGASNFGYELAKFFGLNIVPPRPALVPLIFDEGVLETTKDLSGVSVDARVSCGGAAFREGIVFTHRGVSGPAVLQVSSYWRDGEDLCIDFAPDDDVLSLLKAARQAQPKKMLQNIVSEILPARLAFILAQESDFAQVRMADLSDEKLRSVVQHVKGWRVTPKGSEGYRTAEVTLGGVDTDDLSSKTFAAKNVEGLYFIGEVVDVTGHLGGHNFQWAWASGWCAGQSV